MVLWFFLSILYCGICGIWNLIYWDDFCFLALNYSVFYSPELYKSRVLELNASDDRGINVVRTKIKNFAAVAVGSARQGYALHFSLVFCSVLYQSTVNVFLCTKRVAFLPCCSGYPCPPYKIIVLDEADSMTEDAQANLLLSALTVLLWPHFGHINRDFKSTFAECIASHHGDIFEGYKIFLHL